MASFRLFAGAAGPALPTTDPSASRPAASIVRRLPFRGAFSSPPPEFLAPRETRHPLHLSAASDDAAPADLSGQQRQFSLLFVCLGNICRSPAAEGVFKSLVREKGLDAHFKIDSAGTIGYHEGDPADPRMKMASTKRGIELTSISRPIRPSDFREFDLIVAMDMQNRDDILAKYERWSFKETFPANAHKKVKLMCSYCTRHKETEVPDPYYGGPQGFEKVLDLLQDACESLLDSIIASNGHIFSS
ncbi:uncharacterized protein LOC144716237 [Wolffia australiana]